MLQLVPQTPFSAKLPPRRIKNSLLRTREYLSEHEIEKLRKAACNIGRHGHRDDTLIFLMFRHALRSSEAISLRWEQLDLTKGLFHVRRAKNGLPSTHPLRGPELRALRRLLRDYHQIPYVFCSERKAPLSGRALYHIVARAGETGNFPFKVHPHMLRHSTGFYLAGQGHDTRAIQGYMGHANIKNTVIYTELSAGRFNNFWSD